MVKNPKTYKHSHPINIWEHTEKFLLLLIFPLIRALFFTGFNLKVWLNGAWFDLVVVGIIILMGLWEWFSYVYFLSEDGINIRKGIFIIKLRVIPYNKLSIISLEYPFLFRPIKAVRLRADTDGGHFNSPDFSITIKQEQVDEILVKAIGPFIQKKDIKKIYLPKNFYVAVLSFVVSSTFAGALFVSTFISGIGKILGKEAENLLVGTLTDIAKKLAFGLPPIAGIIAISLLGGWLISFAMNLIRNLKFSATRQSNSLTVTSGVFTKREWLIAVNRINLIELRQTFLTKIFSFYIAFIHCNGYGNKKDELSILMPAGRNKEIMQTIRLLLPEIPICKPTLKPKKRYLSRFLIPPLSWIFGVLVGTIGVNYFFPQLYDIVVFFRIMAFILCFCFLGVKLISYFHTGVGIEKNVYTFQYTYIFRIKTIVVPKERIVKLKIRRSIFQLMSGCCDIVILTYSESKKRHVIPNLNYEEVLLLLKDDVK